MLFFWYDLHAMEVLGLEPYDHSDSPTVSSRKEMIRQRQSAVWTEI